MMNFVKWTGLYILFLITVCVVVFPIYFHLTFNDYSGYFLYVVLPVSVGGIIYTWVNRNE